MTQTKPITAGIIIIGNEILSGRTQDVNISHIAQKLNHLGVHVREARIIPDIEEVIIETVQQFHKQYDYVYSTGGIGPTHDDITAGAMAKAFGRELELNQQSVAIMHKRYGTEHLAEGRLNMARMPKGAKLINNPVTNVPGFQIENVYVMAGIPEVMRGMLDFALQDVVPGNRIVSGSVHCHLTESDLAGGLRELQDVNPNVEIGSYPFWKIGKFGTSIVVRGQDKVSVEKTISQVKDLMVSLGGDPECETDF